MSRLDYEPNVVLGVELKPNIIKNFISQALRGGFKDSNRSSDTLFSAEHNQMGEYKSISIMNKDFTIIKDKKIVNKDGELIGIIDGPIICETKLVRQLKDGEVFEGNITDSKRDIEKVIDNKIYKLKPVAFMSVYRSVHRLGRKNEQIGAINYNIMEMQ